MNKATRENRVERVPYNKDLNYSKDFVESNVNMKPIIETHEKYRKIFKEIIENIK